MPETLTSDQSAIEEFVEEFQAEVDRQLREKLYGFVTVEGPFGWKTAAHDFGEYARLSVEGGFAPAPSAGESRIEALEVFPFMYFGFRKTLTSDELIDHTSRTARDWAEAVGTEQVRIVLLGHRGGKVDGLIRKSTACLKVQAGASDLDAKVQEALDRLKGQGFAEDLYLVSPPDWELTDDQLSETVAHVKLDFLAREGVVVSGAENNFKIAYGVAYPVSHSGGGNSPYCFTTEVTYMFRPLRNDASVRIVEQGE